MTREAELNLAACGVIAAVALAVPPKTRTLGWLVYGFAISRAHGAARDQVRDDLRGTIGRLFSEKLSVAKRVDELEGRVGRLESPASGLIK